MDSRLVILFTFCLFGQCMGHGAMYFPNPWWSQSECSENMSPADCEFHCYKEEEFASNCEPKDNMGCNRGCNLGVMAFFTNYTFVGERTIEKEYIAPHVPYKLSGSAWRWNLNPWNSPGSAKTFGDRDVGDTLVDVLPLKNTKKEDSKVPLTWPVLPGCGEQQLQSFGQQMLSTEEVMLIGFADQWKKAKSGW